MSPTRNGVPKEIKNKRLRRRFGEAGIETSGPRTRDQDYF